MKRITKLLLGISLSFTAACFAAACDTSNPILGAGTQSQASKVATFNNWIAGTDSVSYGSTYQVENIATDDNGDVYPITSVTVRDHEGNTVALEHGKFIASDSDGYTVEYIVEVGEKSFRRTVTLSVSVAPPMLVLSEIKATVFKGSAYTLPTCTVTDYVDGEIANYTIELYKLTETGEAKQEADLSSGVFTFTETGEYYFLYSAVNSGGVTVTAKAELSVILSSPTLTLSDTEALTFKGYGYVIPTCSVTDVVDGEITEYTVEVYKTTDLGFEKQDVDISSGTFTPTETGEYCFLYSSTNSSGVMATAKAKLNVEDRADYDRFFEDVGSEIVKVIKTDENDDWTKINYEGKTAQTTYIEAVADELAEFTGGYTGNAVRYNCTHGYSGKFRVNNEYTEAELIVLAEKYTHVSVWMAYNAVAAAEPTSDTICYGTWGGLLNNAENGNVGNMKPEGSGVWKKYLIKIDKFVELTIAKNNAYAELFQMDIYNLDREKSYIYIGEINFEYIEPTVLTVDKDTAANIVRGGTTGSYVAAGAEEIKDFAGDYTGAASKIAAATGQNCFVKTSYTADEIRALATKHGYTHVSMWIAVTDQVNTGGSSVYNTATGTSWDAIRVANTWQKYTVTIEEFVAQLSGGQVKLINFQSSGTVYFGDIGFETVEE